MENVSAAVNFFVPRFISPREIPFEKPSFSRHAIYTLNKRTGNISSTTIGSKFGWKNGRERLK